MPLSRDWAKSSHSDPNGGNCVQARLSGSDTVQVRDSKNPKGAVLAFSAGHWRRFIVTVKAGSTGI
jgi:hypothetical protein